MTLQMQTSNPKDRSYISQSLPMLLLTFESKELLRVVVIVSVEIVYGTSVSIF